MDTERPEQTESKHGPDAADKGGTEGAKQKDNPSADEVAGAGEGGGLGGRTGAQGGATEVEPGGGHDAGERRK